MGARRASEGASRPSSATAGRLQNTLTLNGRSVAARTAAIIPRAASAPKGPTPIEPNPPALETAAAMAGGETPAIGAWVIGRPTPRVRSNVLKQTLLA